MTAKERALALLNRRDYSRAELIRKLTEKGASEAEATDAVDRLVELGFVDDARYAPILVRHYAAKGYGAQRVRQELHAADPARALGRRAARTAGAGRDDRPPAGCPACGRRPRRPRRAEAGDDYLARRASAGTRSATPSNAILPSMRMPTEMKE